MNELEMQQLYSRLTPLERAMLMQQMIKAQQEQQSQQQRQPQQGGGIGASDMLNLGRQLFGGGGGSEVAGAQLPAAGDVGFIGPTQPGLLSQMGTGASEGFSGLGTTGSAASYALPVASAAGGGYLAYDLGKDIHQNKIKKTGRGYARGAGQGAASGALIGTAIAPGVGTLIGAGIGALAGGIGVAAGHEGTKEAQKRKWGELADKGVLVPEGLSTADQKAAGNTAKNWTFEGARQKLLSGQNPDEFVGVLGNFETFGNDWLGKYTDAQRRDFAKRAAAENLYYSKKGDIFVKDQNRAKAIMDSVLGGGANASVAPQGSFRQLPGTVDPMFNGPVDANAITNINNIGSKLGLPGINYTTSRGDVQSVDAGTAKRWRELKQRR